jgi:hypothetical protein
VRYDKVVAGSRCTLENIERGHHRNGYASDGRVWVAGFESVNGLGVPGNAYLFLNTIDNLLGADLREQKDGKNGNHHFTIPLDSSITMN